MYLKANETQLYEASQERQRIWYDHPIPIGVSVENNKILYGLKNFNQAVEVERRRHPEKTTKVNFVLSVSVTHDRLQTLGSNRVHAHRHSSVAGRDRLYTGKAECAPTGL
jgi:hypothetical protein